jgi:hypothetical protein
MTRLFVRVAPTRRVVGWLDKITADCANEASVIINGPCGARFVATRAIDGRFKTEKWKKRIFQRGVFDWNLVAASQLNRRIVKLGYEFFICADMSGM